MDWKSELKELVRKHALRFGTFTLASGKTASYYLDCRQVTLHPRGANCIAQGMIESMQEAAPDAIGGMAIGADPITASVVTLCGQQGIHIRGFMVRKEAKAHGMGRQVEGPVEPGMRCIIVEDVVTSGGSALQAAAAATQFGLEVIGVMAVIDRLEGGREAIEAAGYRLTSLLDIQDFLPG